MWPARVGDAGHVRAMRLTQSVHFPVQEVTSISRLPNSVESCHFVEFDQHVEWCRQCRGGGKGRKLGNSLCGRGLRLAAEMLRHVVGSADGRIYSRDRACTHFERVEVPLRYRHVHSLFGSFKNSKRKPCGHNCGMRGSLKHLAQQRRVRGGGPEYTVVFRSSTRVSRSSVS